MVLGLAITHKGTDDVVAAELSLLGAKDLSQLEGAVQFSAKDVKALCSITYQLRSATKTIQVLLSDKSMIPKIAGLDFSFLRGKTFAVESEVESLEESEIAELIHAPASKVNLSDPDVRLYACEFSGIQFFGVDLCGFDLGKRDYRIFLGPSNIKGTLACSLLKIAGWNPEKKLLDPFCQSGTIAIEAALEALQKPVGFHLKKSFAFMKLITEDVFEVVDGKVMPEKQLAIFAFDPHFKHISATQKNAKIAQVNKCLQYSRQDIDWLDIKLEKNSIDCIVTSMPPEKDLKKGDIAALFLRAKSVLKKNGTITILAKKQQEILDAAKEYKLKEHRTVWQGQSAMSVLVFEI